jgi:hypothetical protein
LIHKFPLHIIDRAFEEVIASGSFSKTRSFSKIYSEAGLKVSDLYQKTLDVLPQGALFDARQFCQKVDSLISFDLPIDLNSGNMLWLTEKISAETWRLSIEELENDAPTSFESSHDSSVFQVCVHNNRKRKAVGDIVLEKQSINDELANQFYQDVENAGEMGLLVKSYSSSHLEELTEFLKDKVMVVGFDELRVISRKHEKLWQLNLDKDDYITAYSWLGVDGKVDSEIEMMMMDAVCGYLMENPGITKSKLDTLMALVLSPGELSVLLGKLVKMGKCKAKECSVFEPKDFQEFISANQVAVGRITSYWIGDDWLTSGQ